MYIPLIILVLPISYDLLLILTSRLIFQIHTYSLIFSPIFINSHLMHLCISRVLSFYSEFIQIFCKIIVKSDCSIKLIMICILLSISLCHYSCSFLVISILINIATIFFLILHFLLSLTCIL